MSEPRKKQKTQKDERPLFRALVRLEQRGGGFIEPGEVRELEPERAQKLLELGLIEPEGSETARSGEEGAEGDRPLSSSAQDRDS